MTHSSPAVPAPASTHLPWTLWRTSVALSPTLPKKSVTVARAHGPTVETRMWLTRILLPGAAFGVWLATFVIARRSAAVGAREAIADAVIASQNTPTTAVANR